MTNKVGNHPRNTAAMALSLRCGAKTRANGLCRAPAVSGKLRCRMHGGAKGSGGQEGNQNALKHGMYTKEKLEERKKMTQLLQAARQTLRDIRRA